jgi:TetR/AcrR family transcriptional repressor of nem operon
MMGRIRQFDEEEVIDKAVALFRRKGYLATSPRELVEELGISRSSLYDTFTDKRNLFIKALERYKDQTTRWLHELAVNADDPLEAIRQVFQLTIDGCLEETMPRGCFLVNSIVELSPDDKEIITLVQASMKDNEDVFCELIKKGQTAGRITTESTPRALARYLTNCLSGITVSVKAGADRKACKDIVRGSIAALRP